MNILEQILTQKESRIELIKEFQNNVWSSLYKEFGAEEKILSELACDLDFYEPNKEWRKESPSFFDSEHLEEIIKVALSQLDKKNW